MNQAIELMDRAWAARREGRPAEAIDGMTKAIESFRKVGADAELVTALGRLGHIEMDRGNWKAAEDAYAEAMSICRRRDDVHGLAHKTRHMGDVHSHAGRLDEASQMYNEALSLYRSQPFAPPLDLANAIRMVAIDKTQRGQVDEAIQLWREARDLYQGVNVQEGVDECSRYISELGKP